MLPVRQITSRLTKTRAIGVIMLVLLLLSALTRADAAALTSSDKASAADAPKTVARDFLKWYKANRERLDKFDLVFGKPGDSTQAYRVNFAETEKYLAEIKNSGFVSDKYINSFRKYFITADATLEQYPQYDGPAQGFGFDLVLKAHDYGEILDHLKKVKFITKPGTNGTMKVYVRFPGIVMVLVLSKSGGSWLIDSLDYV